MNDDVRRFYLTGLQFLATAGTTVAIRKRLHDFGERYWNGKPNYRTLPETLYPRLMLAVTQLKLAYQNAHPDEKPRNAVCFAMCQVKYFYQRFMGVQNNLLLEHMINCLACHSTAGQARASMGMLGLSEGVLFNAIVLFALNTLNVELTEYERAE